MGRRGLLLLALAAALAALVLADGPGFSGGDAYNPCAEPLRWRIGDVDPRFDVSPAELRSAVEEATAAWERAAGRTLFRHDPDVGLPIGLVYDDRQSSLEARLERIAELKAAQRLTLRLQEEHLSLARRLATRVRRHNEAVALWNRGRGGSEAERLTLESERREIEALRREMEAVEADLRAAMARFNQLVEQADEGPLRVQAGNFEETVRGVDGRRTDASLSVYQFGTREELVRVLAHELGHGLGLGHVDDPTALMHGEYGGAAEGPPEVGAADIAALIAQCDTAWESGPAR